MSIASKVSLAACIAIALSAAVACERLGQNPSTNAPERELKAYEYEVPKHVDWRGELPDIFQHERISSETLVQCGLGHTELKEVPIIPGYPGPGAIEMVQKGEAYLGGVATIEKIKVDCLICDHQYDPDIRAWGKYTSDPKHLHTPLSLAIDQFPVVLAENEEFIVSWKQWVQYGDVVRNAIWYWSDASPAELEDTINAFLASHGQSIEVPKPNGEERTLREYEWTKNGLNYTLNVLRIHEKQKTHIKFVEIIKQTEMTSSERFRMPMEEEAESGKN